MPLSLTRDLYHLALVVAAASQGAGEPNIDVPPHTVDLGYAKYQGVVNAKTGNTQFRGVRYAKAPTGPSFILNGQRSSLHCLSRCPTMERTTAPRTHPRSPNCRRLAPKLSSRCHGSSTRKFFQNATGLNSPDSPLLSEQAPGRVFRGLPLSEVSHKSVPSFGWLA